MEITKEQGQEMAWGNTPDGFKILATEMTGTSRWSITKRVIFTEGGVAGIWAADYSVAATECQDEEPFQYQDIIKCYEVELVQVPAYRAVKRG